MVFLVADPHFGHANIIKYGERPFSSVGEMDEALIHNWNRLIKNDDLVFVLGDFTFYNFGTSSKIMSKLRGRKVLIRGNHDKRSNAWYKDIGFDNVSRYPIIYEKEFILSHAPMELRSNEFCNVHGHIHQKPGWDPIHINVSVEAMDYHPVDFEEIKDYWYGAD